MDGDFLEYVKHDEDSAGGSINALVNFVLDDPPYSLQCSWEDWYAGHDSLTKPYMVASVTKGMMAGLGLYKPNVFVVRYNLEIDRIYWKESIKKVDRHWYENCG